MRVLRECFCSRLHDVPELINLVSSCCRATTPTLFYTATPLNFGLYKYVLLSSFFFVAIVELCFPFARPQFYIFRKPLALKLRNWAHNSNAHLNSHLKSRHCGFSKGFVEQFNHSDYCSILCISLGCIEKLKWTTAKRITIEQWQIIIQLA